MLAPTFDLDRLAVTLDARLRSVLRQHVGRVSRGLLSITLAVPQLSSRRLPLLGKGSVYWAMPGSQDYRLGLSRAATVKGHGERRFEQLERGFSALRHGWTRLDPDGTGLEGQAFLGFSFCSEEAAQTDCDGTSNAHISVPTVLLERRGALCGLTFSHQWGGHEDPDEVRHGWLQVALVLISGITEASRPAPRGEPVRLERTETVPSDAEWLARVEEALSAIRRGALEKVVLTRRIRVAGSRALQPLRLLEWLDDQYPNCVQFAYGGEGYTLVGASPERLVSLAGSRVVSDAVASTAVRDPDQQADTHVGESLLASAKARHEHQLVVNDIVAALQPLCRWLDVPTEPRLLRLPTLQHLWSPVKGEIKPDVSLLQLIGRLHPTPAVGGVPRRAALSWLTEHDEQRGWYTGALGWLSPDGDGAAAVVLRCAVLRGCAADLFAGAGIVADSDPGTELAETELKFQTMLDALARA